MLKIILVSIFGSLLIGCSGQVPYTTLLTETARSGYTAAVEQAASPALDQPLLTESPAEANTESSTSAASSGLLPGIQLFDFVDGEPRWYTVDDNVMGGISSSTVATLKPDYLYFSGTMSLENNGGFASARSEWQPMDLSESDGILMSVLGDGNSYRLRIRSTTTERNVSYNALFDTAPNKPQLVYIPFDEMVPTYFGYVMDVGPLDRANIGSFGFMLSDNQPGEFELAIDWVRAVSEAELLALRS